jgi:hypothetical protein
MLWCLVALCLTSTGCTFSTGPDDFEDEGPGAGRLTFNVKPLPVPAQGITVSGQSIKLTRALLSVKSVELRDGPGGGGTGASGGASVLDLQSSAVQPLLDRASVTEGEWGDVFIHHGPAASGASQGYTLLLEGTATRSGVTRDFTVRMTSESTEKELIADYDFVGSSASSRTGTVEFDTSKLFNFVETDFFDRSVTVSGNSVTVDSTHNTELLEDFAFNLASAYGSVVLN